MSKKTSYDFNKGNRQREIERCKHCSGAPEPKEFNLQGMCGTFCNHEIGGHPCMQVITWKREGEATVIKTKHQLSSTSSGGITTTVDVVTELTPGEGSKISFGDLKIQ